MWCQVQVERSLRNALQLLLFCQLWLEAAADDDWLRHPIRAVRVSEERMAYKMETVPDLLSLKLYCAVCSALFVQNNAHVSLSCGRACPLLWLAVIEKQQPQFI